MTIPPADTPHPAVNPSLIEPPKPLDGFASQEFKARRDALRAAYPNGLILARGTAEDDIPHTVAATFRQSSAFFYLTGVETPGAYLVLLPEDVPASAGIRDTPPDVREILFLPARNPATETWTGAKLGPGEETEKATGITKTADANGLWNALVGWLRRNPVVYTLTPYGEQAKGTREYALMQKIAEIAPVVQFRDCSGALGQLRMVKSPAEIERMREAIAITVEGQKAARAVIARGAGRWEYEVEAAVYAAFRSRGARCAFSPIAGAGLHATVLHYEQNHCQMQAGEVVVVDIGARVGSYNGDLTRSYPVGGVFSPRQREIYNLVLDTYEQAVANYQPGEDSLKTINDRCKAYLKDLPHRAKDANGAEQTMDTFMPHGLSHHLGLDVHDVGERETLLLPGCILTIEPGLYIPSEGIGVRIEDDYLVTPTGLERLGPLLERDPDAVEDSMKG